MICSNSSLRPYLVLFVGVLGIGNLGCATPLRTTTAKLALGSHQKPGATYTPPLPKQQPLAVHSREGAQPAAKRRAVQPSKSRMRAKRKAKARHQLAVAQAHLTSWFQPPPPNWMAPPVAKIKPPAQPPYPSIELPKHKSFRWIVKQFGTSKWGFTRTILKRRGLYSDIVLRELKRMHLPLGLIVLAGIESNYTPRLVSPTGAMGMWQFIDTTGRDVGLKRTPWIDERRDLVKSTRAALRYVHQLYQMFDGDWGLAIAAYNCGPGCVRAAMARCKGKSIWSIRLWRGCGLSKEASLYVARFFGLLYFLKHPPNGWKSFPMLEPIQYKTVATPHAINLIALSQATGIALRQLYELNPELTSWMTPPETRYPLKIPPAAVAKVQQYFRRPKGDIEWRPLKLEKGVTLAKICRKYRIPRNVLRQVNRTWGRWSLDKRSYLMLPLPKGAKAWPRRLKSRHRKKLYTLARASQRYRWRFPSYFRYHSRQRYISHKKKLPCYTVRKGDTFRRIARRFKVPTRHLRKRNHHIATLRKGHKLRIFAASRCYAAPPSPIRSFRLPLAD